MNTYTINEIEAYGARIADRLIAKSVESGENANVAVADRDAAKALLRYIEEDTIDSRHAWLDIGGGILKVWGVDNDEAGGFIVCVNVRS